MENKKSGAKTKVRPQWGADCSPVYIGLIKAFKDVEGFKAIAKKDIINKFASDEKISPEHLELVRPVLESRMETLLANLTTHEYFGVVVTANSAGETAGVYLSSAYYKGDKLNEVKTEEVTKGHGACGGCGEVHEMEDSDVEEIIKLSKLNLTLLLARLKSDTRKNKDVVLLAEVEGVECAKLTGEAMEAFGVLYSQDPAGSKSSTLEGLGAVESTESAKGILIQGEIEAIRAKHGDKAAEDMIKRLFGKK